MAACAGGAVLGLSVAGRDQGTVLAAGSEGLREPGHDRRGDVVILGHQVRGLLVAVHLRLRHALHQVEEVAALEHRVLRSPLEERGHVQVANLLGDALHGRVRGHVGAGGNIAHEVAHALAPGRVGVGGAVCTVNRLVQRARVQALGLLTRRLRQGTARGASAGGSGFGQTTLVLSQTQGHVNKRGRIVRTPLVHAQRQAQGGGNVLDAVVVHRGVGQQHAREKVAVLQGPAKGNEAAPIVGEGHDRLVGLIQAQGLRKVAQVCDAVLQAAALALQVQVGALREAHVNLVDRHHAPRGALVHVRIQHGAPQVRPGRVAVHAQNRADGLQAAFGEHRQVVQVVPAARVRLLRPPLNGGGGGHLQPVGVARVHARPLLRVVGRLGLGEVQVTHTGGPSGRGLRRLAESVRGCRVGGGERAEGPAGASRYH